MAYEFDGVHPARFDDAGTIVFAIATDKAKKRSHVRLEASRTYVEDVWRLDWNRDRDAILKRFEAKRAQYLDKCQEASLDDYEATAFYQIG